jgi:ankyrin repeat protein
VVEALVKAGANVNRMDRHKKTPLWLSVTRGWYLCVEALLKAPTIQVGHNASFPNMLASLIGNAASSFNPHAAYECTRLLLATGAITAHVVNASQAIHTAAQLGRPKLLELLLSVPGVNINAVQPPSNRAVIHRAVLGNTVELLEYILTVPGLQIDQLTAVGESALVMAIRHFRYDYIDMLLKAGAQTLSVRFGAQLI